MCSPTGKHIRDHGEIRQLNENRRLICVRLKIKSLKKTSIHAHRQNKNHWIQAKINIYTNLSFHLRLLILRPLCVRREDDVPLFIVYSQQ